MIPATSSRAKPTSSRPSVRLGKSAGLRNQSAHSGQRGFGPAGAGFLRFSTAEPDDRLVQAVRFLADAITRTDRVKSYLEANPKYRST